MNQVQSLPTSLPYTQTPRSQQWLPQNTQSNLNITASSGLPTQVPINVSVPQAQNINIHIGEGVQINLLPGTQRQMQRRQQLHLQQQPPQQQPQNSNMFQNQMNQQLLKEKIRHGNLRPTHMQQESQSPKQQQQHPQSLLKQPIQQSFPQPGQQNSQLLPRNQFSTQLVCSSHQQQMAMPSQEQKKQEQDRLFSQLMNQDAQKRQNNGEQHGVFRVSSCQQNNNVSYQAMAQQNTSLQNTHQQRLNASAFASQQLQNMSRGGQSGKFNVPRSSFLGTQGQEMGQTQPMMLQQYQPQHHPAQQQQQPQNRSLPQHLDPGQNDTQRFQATSSLRQTQNITDQQIQQYQFERAPLANPSSMFNFLCYLSIFSLSMILVLIFLWLKNSL